ncbi:hypothetical protein C8J57DRAFT_1494967 [Mycena rebaudengoi]|nr:hypothetical protein C8J57DRAFT_1494967 [Mycena rebaudengoi]
MDARDAFAAHSEHCLDAMATPNQPLYNRLIPGSIELPAELEELIIDHLHADTHALATCALVSRAWIVVSQYHLFGSVTLRLIARSERFVLVSQSPLATISPFVRNLALFDLSVRNRLFDLVPRLPHFPYVRSLQLCWDFRWHTVSID